MSLVPVDSPTADDLYCSTEDVADYFEKFDDFDATTDPTGTDVERRIAAESEWVDSFTDHAWRERRVEREYHDLDGPYNYRQGLPIALVYRNIRTPFDASKGDKIEVWRGSDYDDFVGDDEFSQGRDEDFWIDETRGILYIYRRYAYFSRTNEIRVSYRFGKENVPQLIRDAVARRVAAYYLEAQTYRMTTPGNEEAPKPGQIADKWREQTETDLQPYCEVRSTGM